MARKIREGTQTSSIVHAIERGATTLREIADATRIDYRSVNAIVDSLERQWRVEADNYAMPRCKHRFCIIAEPEREARRMTFFAINGNPIAKPRRTPNPRNIVRFPTVPTELYLMYGIRPLDLPAFRGTSHVHRA